jgi:prepilin-type N-terminal cleavage/methylation domain-containing protein
MKRSKDLNGGFTLIELVVVMAIIAFLMLVLIGGILVARTASRTAANRTNGNSIRLAMEAYYAKNTRYPVIPSGNASILPANVGSAVVGNTVATTASPNGLLGFGIDNSGTSSLKTDGCSNSGTYVLSVTTGYAIWVANAPTTGTTCTAPATTDTATITGP